MKIKQADQACFIIKEFVFLQKTNTIFGTEKMAITKLGKKNYLYGLLVKSTNKDAKTPR